MDFYITPIETNCSNKKFNDRRYLMKFLQTNLRHLSAWQKYLITQLWNYTQGTKSSVFYSKLQIFIRPGIYLFSYNGQFSLRENPISILQNQVRTQKR